jgi:hypothetical protein
MTPDTITSFLNDYIGSLGERSRAEKARTQYGFDWIMYNLGLALEWKAIRLPWLRGTAGEMAKTKTEPEFGVDLSFLDQNGEVLVIFVLKDEVLSYKNWIAEGFESDLRRAAAPNLSGAGLEKVREVVVIVAYNKDEDARGVESYENTIRTLGTKIGENVSLRFERWNLTEITERVGKHLLTPSLLPQTFYGEFTYICAQFADFTHGSDEWVNQLVPNWRRFLGSLLRSPLDKRVIRLLPVTLVILRGHARNSSASTGWLDIVEWATLKAWSTSLISGDDDVAEVAALMWSELYMAELERFYESNREAVETEHSLEQQRTGTTLDALAASYIVFWHLGRLGLLVAGLQEMRDNASGGTAADYHSRISLAAQNLVNLSRGHPSAMRPALDANHVELFLVWRTLWTCDLRDQIWDWMAELQQRLMTRRGKAPLPFICGINSLEIAFERALQTDAVYFGDSSSYLLLMLLELCFSTEGENRDVLLRQYFLKVVLGIDDSGKQVGDTKPITLTGWEPAADWGTRVLTEAVTDGASIAVQLLPRLDQDDAGVTDQLRAFIEQTRAEYSVKVPSIPSAVFILACLKNQSPLPSFFWRDFLFPRGGPPMPTKARSADNALNSDGARV